MTFAVRFRTYEPATDNEVGFLPEPTKFKTGFIHNADGALLITYSELADGGAAAATALETGLDVAFEVNWTGESTGWIEPFDSRFLLLKRNIRLDDDAKMHDLIFVPYSWLTSRVRNLNLAAVEGTKSSHAGQRKMYLKDAGDIMKTFLAEHEGRGNPIPITRESWTVDHDSLGNPWAEHRTLYYNVGQDIHSVLDNLTDLDLCDWRFAGRDMRMYNADGICVDLSETVTLTMGDDLGEAPSEESMEDYLRRILVKGSKKKKVTVTATSGPTVYGDWEGFIDDGGVDDTADLTSDGNKEFEAKNRMRGTYDRDLTLNGTWLPFRDYNKGDWVNAPAIVNSQRMRVQQITITGENGVISGSVTLNDRVKDTELARASKLASLAGGVQEVTGSGTSSDDQEPDTRQPDAPTGLTVTPELHLNATGHWIVRLAFAWTPNEVATDGTALDIAAYTVWGTGPGEAAAHMIGQAAASSPALISDGYAPGSEWAFTVQAHGVTTTDPGLQSATVGITLPTDTEAPPATSIPTLESSASILSVSWDGLDSVGDPMPADLARVEVLADTVNPPVTVVGNLGAQNNWLGYVTSGTTVYVAFRAVDTADNVGPLSAVSSTVVRSVVDDADLAAVLALKATTYVQDAEPVDPPAGSWWWTATAPLKLSYTADGITWTTKQVDAAEFLAVGTIVTQLLAAGSVQADTIAADSILSYHLTAGVITADKVAAGLLSALVIAGEVIKTAETGKRVVIDASGITLYDADDTPVTFINTDGESFFTGTVSATSLKVIGSMELNSADNVMNPGSVLILSAGIQAPGTGPAVTNYWPSIQLKDEAGNPITPSAVARTVDGDWVSYSHGSFVVGGVTYSRIYMVHDSTGAWTASVPPASAGVGDGIEGVTVIRGTDSEDYAISYCYNGESGTGNYYGFYWTKLSDGTGGHVDGDFDTNWFHPFTGSSPVLGNDGSTGLLFAYDTKIRMYTVALPAGTVTYSTVKTSTQTGPTAVCRSNFDLGVDTLGVATDSNSRFYTYATMAENTAEAFPLATTAWTVGMGYAGSAFWVAKATGLVHTYDGVTFTGATTSKSYEFGATYYDSVNGYESKLGPKVAASIKRRARIKVNLAGWAATAEIPEIRFYGAAAGGTQYAQGASATGTITLTAVVTAGSTPPASSTFPAATPAKITNPEGTLVIGADGKIYQVNGFRFKGDISAAQAVASGYSRLSWTESSDEGDCFDGTFFTAPEDGRYDFSVALQTGTSSNRRYWRATVGDAAPGSNPDLGRYEGPASGYSGTVLTYLDVPLTAGDKVSIEIYASAALTTTTGIRPDFGACYFNGRRAI